MFASLKLVYSSEGALERCFSKSVGQNFARTLSTLCVHSPSVKNVAQFFRKKV